MGKKLNNTVFFRLVCTVSLLFLSLEVGKYDVSLTRMISGKITDPLDYKVFYQLRLPRTLMALYAGFALSLVGALMQTIFKNPLASPDIMGVSSGAGAGAIAAATVGGKLALGVASAAGAATAGGGAVSLRS